MGEGNKKRGYKVIRETEGESIRLPDDKEYHILKDELIGLTSKTAREANTDQIVLRRVVVYQSEDNKTI